MMPPVSAPGLFGVRKIGVSNPGTIPQTQYKRTNQIFLDINNLLKINLLLFYSGPLTKRRPSS